ncbi:hypothetical protein, partial [Burkholderia metallica]|uniref:hypothetical protein n=1 Tax=Burkholderia metallica TaxID=488729 RepID=UPI001CF1F62B
MADIVTSLRPTNVVKLVIRDKRANMSIPEPEMRGADQKPTFCIQMVLRRGLGHVCAIRAELEGALLAGPEMKKGRLKADLFYKSSGAQERTRSHVRDPGSACKRCLSSPRAKRAGALL